MRTAAFSLLEVVVAIGVFAVVLVVVLGGFGPVARSARAVDDTGAVARLAGGIQQELERLQSGRGLDGLAAAVPPPDSAVPLRLVGTRDGRRVLAADGDAAAADRALNDPELPGIARRDRYFVVEVIRQPDLPYAPGGGFLAVSARVMWPYQLPAGPPTPDATRVDADPAREVPAAERSWTVYNFALRP